MTIEPLICTVNVENASDVVTVTDAVLTDLNCRPPATVFIDGLGFSVVERLTTTTFKVSREWAGSTGSGLACEIAPFTAEMSSRTELSRSLINYSAKLDIMNAKGMGLFYYLEGVTGATDPGPGKVSVDDADWTAVTAAYIDVLDATGRDRSARIDLLSNGSFLQFESIETGAYQQYRVTTSPSNEGPDEWRKVENLEYIGGDGLLADGESVRLVLIQNGAGLAYDAQAADMPGRAAYKSAAAGYAVLVDNIGDGRAAVFVKLSGADDDWSTGALVTGPEGGKGDRGWTPVHDLYADGVRILNKLVGYTGGEGTAPTINIGKYQATAGGYTESTGSARDLRGTPGAIWYQGTAAPSDGVGIDDDYYFRTTTGDIYQKDSGSWGSVISNIFGRPVGHRLEYSDTVTDSDPGAGKFQLNNATLGSVTKLWVNHADLDAINIAPWLATFDDNVNTNGRGTLTFQGQYSPAIKLGLTITGPRVDKTGYSEFPVTAVSGALPADGSIVVGSFSASGSDGTDGSDGGGFPGIVLRAASTSNIDLSTDLEAGDSAGGVTLSAGNAFGAFGQTAPEENGIYVVQATGAAVRHSSFDAYDENCGAIFTVLEGDLAGDVYKCVSVKGGTIDSTALEFLPLSPAGYDPNTAVLALELATAKVGTVTLADGKADSFASAASIDAGNSSNYQFDAALDVVKPTYDPGDTLLLLHFDGADASTTFTDSSYYTRTVTAVGNAQLDTAQKKFGTASALFDGSGDRLSVADSPDFDLGTGDFTVEFFVRFPGAASDYSVCEIGTFAAGFELGVGANSVYVYTAGDTGNNITVTAWSSSTWYHVAACRDGNNLRTFVDGALVGTRDVTGRSISTSDGLRIGGRGTGALSLNGWVDELRVSDVARYTAAFTPPAAPLSGPAPHNMAVRSSARVAPSAPDTGRVAIQLVENEAITINTDVVAKYSRDDGVTFETATLSLLTTEGSTKLYQDSNIDLSGQTSGTDMVWQVETANNVDVYLSGVVDQQQ